MHVSCQFDPRTPRKLVQLSCVAVASEDNVTDVKFSCSYGGSFSSLIASGRVDEACSSFRAIRAAGHLQTHQDAQPLHRRHSTTARTSRTVPLRRPHGRRRRRRHHLCCTRTLRRLLARPSSNRLCPSPCRPPSRGHLFWCPIRQDPGQAASRRLPLRHPHPPAASLPRRPGVFGRLHFGVPLARRMTPTPQVRCLRHIVVPDQSHHPVRQGAVRATTTPHNLGRCKRRRPMARGP